MPLQCFSSALTLSRSLQRKSSARNSRASQAGSARRSCREAGELAAWALLQLLSDWSAVPHERRTSSKTCRAPARVRRASCSRAADGAALQSHSASIPQTYAAEAMPLQVCMSQRAARVVTVVYTQHTRCVLLNKDPFISARLTTCSARLAASSACVSAIRLVVQALDSCMYSSGSLVIVPHLALTQQQNKQTHLTQPEELSSRNSGRAGTCSCLAITHHAWQVAPPKCRVAGARVLGFCDKKNCSDEVRHNRPHLRPSTAFVLIPRPQSVGCPGTCTSQIAVSISVALIPPRGPAARPGPAGHSPSWYVGRPARLLLRQRCRAPGCARARSLAPAAARWACTSAPRTARMATRRSSSLLTARTAARRRRKRVRPWRAHTAALSDACCGLGPATWPVLSLTAATGLSVLAAGAWALGLHAEPERPDPA